jgi:F0F1-type ATP synthase assembly protein I
MADKLSNDGNKKSGGQPGGAFGELVKAESMIQLAIALPAGCLIGWLLGSWLDRHFHQGWIGIAGIVLGAIGGFIQIFTTASRYLKRD